MSKLAFEIEDVSTLIGQKVQAYMNLNTLKWSIRAQVRLKNGKKEWRVVKHLDFLVIQPTKYRLSDKSRLSMVAKGSKEVHAWIEGTLLDFNNPHEANGTTISYNPYYANYFYDSSNRKEFNDLTKPLFFDHRTKKVHSF
jgi:hypothetical protein